MDQTAVHEGTPPQKPMTTAIQAGPPATAPKLGKPEHPAYVVLEKLADLRITVALMVLSMLIVFWGTLAQVDQGIWTVVGKYFRSFLVFVPLKVILFNAIDNRELAIPFPGGWAIGSAMMINLLAAHIIRFKLTWARSGILLIHAGLIVMMIGEVVTGVYQIERNMVIKVGETASTVVQPGKTELAVIRRIDTKKDQVVTVPGRMLQEGSVVEHEELPFKALVRVYMVNSNLLNANHNPNRHAKNPATHGTGLSVIADPVSETSGVDPNQKHDQPSVYVKLTSRTGKDLGTWLLSVGLDEQWIEVDGVMYQIALRFKHSALPYQMHLNKFTHAKFQGTETPKDFRSYIRLIDAEEGVDRDVEIYMNNPLYYRGQTFYQSSWTTDPMGKANGTVLQVVQNPGWLLPYISCLIVGIGMLVHFGLTLYRFLERRVVR